MTDRSARFQGQTAVVTGGTGFLGKALVKRLLQQGAIVKTIQRSFNPELEKLGVEQLCADISGLDTLPIRFFKGVTNIFHTAAKVEMWGDREEFEKINITGTQNLLRRAEEAGVANFIFTSSPSVIASGVDLRGVNEKAPYPKKFHAQYPATKAAAEILVRHHEGRTRTVTLRPHLIYGPGDTSLEALVVKKARAGRLIQVGSGENLADFCHIDDCVEGHLLAAEALSHTPELSGAVFFISQGKPIPLWDWIQAVLRRHGLPPVTRKVSKGLAIRLGTVFETISKISGGLIDPPFTRFLAEEMATDHYFDISAARSRLGFAPADRDPYNW